MKIVEAQYGFEEFEVPEYAVELLDDPAFIRCTMIDGNFIDEWVEISDIRFSDIINEDGTSELTYQFNSSRGTDDNDLTDLSAKILQYMLIDTMKYLDLVVYSVGC